MLLLFSSLNDSALLVRLHELLLPLLLDLLGSYLLFS